MRCLFAALAAVAALAGASSAHAEKKIFIVANYADGYGVDRCLATGASCGAAVAAAYCRSREFAQAAAYRKVERGDITGASSQVAADACASGSCEDFVAIECTR
jgi:hypothetical protein